MLIETHVLPLWNIVMYTDGQSQLAYFLPSSTEFHLTPNLKTADGKLRLFLKIGDITSAGGCIQNTIPQLVLYGFSVVLMLLIVLSPV